MLRLAMSGVGFRQIAADHPTFFYRDTPNSLWRRSTKNIRSMVELQHRFRRVELFLRSSSPELSQEARLALASRYSRFLEDFLELDPDTFDESVAWIRALGFRVPPNVGGTLRLASHLMGFEHAARLRHAYRARRGPVRVNRSARP